MLVAFTVLVMAANNPSSAIQALPLGGAADLASLGAYNFDTPMDHGVGPAIEMAKVTPKPRSRPESFWIVETPAPFFIADLSARDSVQDGRRWADSRSCPILASLAAALPANPGRGWWDEALKSLTPCWSDTPPPI